MARSAPLFALATLLVLVCVTGTASAGLPHPSRNGSVYLRDNVYTFVLGKVDPAAVSYGTFTDATQHPSNFGELVVHTNSKFEATAQMYAAGYLEGALTRERNYEHWQNINGYVVDQFSNKTLPPVIVSWLDEQDAFVKKNIASNKSAEWTEMANLYAQFEGLIAGHNDNSPASLQMTRLGFMITNGIGDLLSLIPALVPSARIDWASLTEDEMITKLSLRGHCSGFIKVTGNYSEMFAGHSSWFTYASMLRIWKSYDLGTGVPGAKMSFSSYPGLLSSLDDFYMMLNSKLVMVQTTNGVLNNSLYKLVTPDSLLAWHRVRLANMLSNTGEEWATTVGLYNSGTYTNSYMVVDYKKFTPGQALPAGTLWTVEQIPGLSMSADVTQFLERGYWPSYNVPFFPEVYQKSGYKEFYDRFQATHPEAVAGVSYQLAPRAKIFRRSQGTAVDLESFKRVLRSNDYEDDPYFPKKNPFNAICSRGDLAGATGGCYDTKATSYEWITAQKASVINGPTTAGGTLPPFKWTAQFDSTPHVGEPEEFDFEFEDFTNPA